MSQTGVPANQGADGPVVAADGLSQPQWAEPLWMPNGSVRAILVLSMTFFTYYAVAAGVALPTFWEYLWGGALALYGVSRTMAANTPK